MGIFTSFKSEDEDSGKDGDIHEEITLGTILLHNSKAYRPVDDIWEGIELSVADMVNH